ncbi:MAG: hypothetical protein WC139_11620 [Candidatus Kapaibacterium sp.]
MSGLGLVEVFIFVMNDDPNKFAGTEKKITGTSLLLILNLKITERSVFTLSTISQKS